MCHEIAKKSEVAVVDVGTVEFNDATQFLHDGSSGGFDAKDIEYLHATVGVCSPEVDTLDTHHGLEVDTVRLQHPLFLVVRSDASIWRNHDLILLRQEYTPDSLYTT